MLGAALVLSVLSCGDTILGPDPGVEDVGFARKPALHVEPSSVRVMVGETVVLTAADAGVAVAAKWTTSDAGVASVDGAGVVTGLRAGTAVITARWRSSSGSVNVVVEENAAPPPPPPPPVTQPGSGGIWIGASELAALPVSGAAWNAVKSMADRDCGSANLSDQDQDNNVCILAKALVYGRIGGSHYRDAVVSAIRSIADGGRYSGRALALGRELAAYVIAADVIGLSRVDAALDTRFRSRLREFLTTPTSDGPRNLVECHEQRPNNWGTHCGASRAAVAAYLGDATELQRTAQVFRGWLGDRSAYSGFRYGSDLSWQCDSTRPVPVNPRGCTKDGRPLDGVLPDDQRRGGSFTWPPPRENYVYEALQGALVQAVILSRHGHDVWNWQDRALLRAFEWLHHVAGYAATGDDTWQPHIINRVYGTGFPAPTPSRPGKNMGWTDWTHR